MYLTEDLYLLTFQHGAGGLMGAASRSVSVEARRRCAFNRCLCLGHERGGLEKGSLKAFPVINSNFTQQTIESQFGMKARRRLSSSPLKVTGVICFRF